MKDIYKFLLNTTLMGLAVLLTVMAGFFCTADRIGIPYSLKYKHQLLQKTSGARVVFIGGSNIRFGMIS